QIYLYMTTYKRDPLFIKVYVGVLMLADTLNTGFMTAYLYDSLIVHFSKWCSKHSQYFTDAWAQTILLGGLASAAAIAFVPQFSHFQEFQVPVICWLMSAAVGDVLITGTLGRRNHRTGCSATDTRVDQIIRCIPSTGMITSLCSVIDLGLFLGDPPHLLFNLPLAKLYSNSLMSSLNAR
ncbi:hypothetical protein B0H17DRAFT_832243, partial [Mycena rosella]